METTFTFGSNRFAGGTVVPLCIGDRYVVVEPNSGGRPYISVMHDVGSATPRFEVVRNEPGQGEGFSAEKAQNGFVIVGETDDDFEYKVRPDSETTVVFGTLRGEDLEVKITDRAIHVGGASYSNNTLVGTQVGLTVRRDGTISLGGGALPPSLISLLAPT